MGVDRLCEVPATHASWSRPPSSRRAPAQCDMNPVPTPCPYRCVQILLAVLQHIHDGPHRWQWGPGPEDTWRWAQHLRVTEASRVTAPFAFSLPSGRLLGQHSRDQ